MRLSRLPKRRLRCLLLTLSIAGTLGVYDLAVADPLESGRIFGEAGKKFTNFKPLPKWPNLLDRYRAEELKDSRCRDSGRGRCPYTEWNEKIAQLRDKPKAEQVREINRWANTWTYVTDLANWGIADYWATPGEFFARSGDCEDYAIVKFISLRALGFDNDQLRIVGVEDLNLQVGHSITLVELDGQVQLLDNQIKGVVRAETVHHYKPVYAVNEDAWWLYP